MKNQAIIPPAIIGLKCSRIVPGQVGVFALTDLPAGTIVGAVDLLHEGPFVPWSEYPSFTQETQEKIDAFCLGTAEGFTLPADFNYLSVPWYLNHSCEGQVGFDAEGNFVLIRDVAAGEELTYDYGLAEANPEFRMNCQCGSKSCRGVITGNDWKNPEFRRKSLGFMLPELRSNDGQAGPPHHG